MTNDILAYFVLGCMIFVFVAPFLVDIFFRLFMDKEIERKFLQKMRQERSCKANS